MPYAGIRIKFVLAMAFMVLLLNLMLGVFTYYDYIFSGKSIECCDNQELQTLMLVVVVVCSGIVLQCH